MLILASSVKIRVFKTLVLKRVAIFLIQKSLQFFVDYVICAPKGEAMSFDGQKSLERIVALRGVEVLSRELFSATIRYAGSDFEIRRLCEPVGIAIIPRAQYEEQMKKRQAEFFSKQDEFHMNSEF